LQQLLFDAFFKTGAEFDKSSLHWLEWPQLARVRIYDVSFAFALHSFKPADLNDVVSDLAWFGLN
jgi:hypothetical protein